MNFSSSPGLWRAGFRTMFQFKIFTMFEWSQTCAKPANPHLVSMVSYGQILTSHSERDQYPGDIDRTRTFLKENIVISISSHMTHHFTRTCACLRIYHRTGLRGAAIGVVGYTYLCPNISNSRRRPSVS